MPWVYARSSCVFHQYFAHETLSCLNNAWVPIVGDSNMQDWKRNLVAVLLGARRVWRNQQARAADDVWTLQQPLSQPSSGPTPHESYVRITLAAEEP